MHPTTYIRWNTVRLFVLWSLVIAPAVLAGGFHISVETPVDAADPEFNNAVLLERTFGCHQPTDASVFATAEGLVKGKRQTIKLQLKPTSQGVYAMRQQWPSEGVWMLAVRGSYLGRHSSVLVELEPDGTIAASKPGSQELQFKTLHRGLSKQEIEAALDSLGARRVSASQQVAK